MDSVDIEVLRSAEAWRKEGRRATLGTIRITSYNVCYTKLLRCRTKGTVTFTETVFG